MPRFRKLWIVPILAVLTTAGVPLAAASGANDAGRAGVRAGAAEDPMVTDTKKLLDRSIELWSENKLDEIVAGHYTEDAVVLAPNHEPIRGRPAILAYLKTYRDVLGEFDKGDYLIQATPSGNMASWVGQYTFHDGKLRLVSHERYVRHPTAP